LEEAIDVGVRVCLDAVKGNPGIGIHIAVIVQGMVCDYSKGWAFCHEFFNYPGDSTAADSPGSGALLHHHFLAGKLSKQLPRQEK
jgi:hypothetical protein